MKKVLALLLALIIALSMALVSCGDTDDDGESKKSKETGIETNSDKDDTKDEGKEPSDDEDSLVGEWGWDFDMSGLIAAMMGAFADIDADDLDELLLPVTFEFEKDGKYTMSIDEKAFKKNYKAFLKSFKPVLTDMIEEMLKDQAKESGVTYDEMLDAFEEQVGMSLKDYIDASMNEEMDFDELFAGSGLEDRTTGTYKVKGNKLTLDSGEDDESEFTFKLKGDKLTLDADDIPDEFADFIDLPIVLERK